MAKKTKAEIEQELSAALAKIGRLEKKLEKTSEPSALAIDLVDDLQLYIHHTAGCPTHHTPPSICDCGLAQVLERANQFVEN